MGFDVVPRDAVAGAVHGSEEELRHGVSLLGGQAVPPGGFRGVLWDAFAAVVHGSEDALRLGVSLLGGQAEPPGGFRGVPRDAFAAAVHGSEDALRAGVSLLGGQAVPPDGFRGVLKGCRRRAWGLIRLGAAGWAGCSMHQQGGGNKGYMEPVNHAAIGIFWLRRAVLSRSSPDFPVKTKWHNLHLVNSDSR